MTTRPLSPRLLKIGALLAVVAICFMLMKRFVAAPSSERVVVQTTPDAFTMSVPNRNQPGTSESEGVLVLSITPAPWPPEAKRILDLAKDGRLVTVVFDSSKGERPSFDIVGVNEENGLIVRVASRDAAVKLLDALGLVAR